MVELSPEDRSDISDCTSPFRTALFDDRRASSDDLGDGGGTSPGEVDVLGGSNVAIDLLGGNGETRPVGEPFVVPDVSTANRVGEDRDDGDDVGLHGIAGPRGEDTDDLGNFVGGASIAALVWMMIVESPCKADGIWTSCVCNFKAAQSSFTESASATLSLQRS